MTNRYDHPRAARSRAKLGNLTSLGHVLMAAAGFAALSCQGEEYETPLETEDEIVLGVALEGLGTDVATCTAADSTSPTGFVASTKTLNLTLAANTDAVLSVVSGKLKVNGWQCKTAAIVGPPAVASVDLTTTNVTKINIAAASTNKVVIDLLPGTFGNVFTSTGGIVITGTGMSVGVRGTAAANLVKVAQEGSGATGPFYFELSGDTRADVKIDGNPGPVSFALGDGADTFTAQGQVLTTSALGGSGATTDVASEPLTVFGGPGADTLKGGLGNDTLDGGDGNDVFTTSATNVDDGNDTYIGGANTDTMDYSARTAALDVSVAPTYDNGWVEGLNIFNATVGAGAVLTYDSGAGSATVTFPGSTTTGIAAILNVLNVSATPALVGATAGVNDRGEIFFKKTGAAGALSVNTGGAGTTLIGGANKSNNGVSELALDADDGMSGEGDDVRSDVENVTGGSGNDVLTGSIVSNTLNGGAGDDDIAGGLPNGTCASDVDALNGGDGNDKFRLGTLTNCADVVDGGNGTDVASYEMRTLALTVDIDNAGDDGETDETDNIKTTVEVLLGGAGNDTLTGGTGNDEIHGFSGADLINGGTGADSLVGGPGADTLLGGTGEDYFNEKDVADTAFVQSVLPSAAAQSDIINGGADFDTVDYGRTSTAALTASLCVATTTTANGACTGTNDADNNDPDTDDLTNVEHFIGGAGADTIFGSTGADYIEGGAGADSLLGGAGNDTLFGDADNDVLSGEAGDDALDGGTGTNTLAGGAGDDICTAGTADATCEL